MGFRLKYRPPGARKMREKSLVMREVFLERAPRTRTAMRKSQNTSNVFNTSSEGEMEISNGDPQLSSPRTPAHSIKCKTSSSSSGVYLYIEKRVSPTYQTHPPPMWWWVGRVYSCTVFFIRNRD